MSEQVIAEGNSNKSSRNLFIDSLKSICGEVNEAIMHATELLSGAELLQARRELARIMEIVEVKLMPLAAPETSPPNDDE